MLAPRSKPRSLRSRVALFGLSLAVGAMFIACGGGGGGTSQPPITTAIQVSIRPSHLDSSTGVLQVKNRTGQSLSLFLSMHDRDSNQQKSHSLTLGPYETQENGILEAGWKFEPNESITIACTGYNSAAYTTFKTDKGTVGIKEPWW